MSGIRGLTLEAMHFNGLSGFKFQPHVTISPPFITQIVVCARTIKTGAKWFAGRRLSWLLKVSNATPSTEALERL